MQKGMICAARGRCPNFGYALLALMVWLNLGTDPSHASSLTESGPSSEFAFGNGDADDWNLDTLKSLNAQFATSVDPVALAEGTVLESLKQDEELRQVVVTTTALRTIEPISASPGSTYSALQSAELGSATSRSDQSDGTPSPSAQAQARADRHPASAAARPVPRETQSVDVDEVSLNEPPDGATLDQALRSIVTKKAGTKPNSAATAISSATDDMDSADDEDVVLGDGVLDSRALAEALQAIVQPVVMVDGSQGFSILGQGQFELQLSNDLTTVSFSELSTGVSITVPTGQPQHDQEAPPQGKEEHKITLVAYALNFIRTPTGTLAMITAGVLVLVWAMTRLAVAIRR